jgi:hypothetical protein
MVLDPGRDSPGCRPSHPAPRGVVLTELSTCRVPSARTDSSPLPEPVFGPSIRDVALVAERAGRDLTSIAAG